MDLIDKIQELARKEGNLMLNARHMHIEEKEGIGNVVTEYDKKIQQDLKQELLKLIPDSNFVGEENNDIESIKKDGYTFIVDPIDGTYNFSRGLHMSMISIALLKDSKQYMAVCYNPYIDEMYYAIDGKGAYLNNKRIHVSNKELNDGIVFIGSSPYYKDKRKKSLEILTNFANNSLDFRRSGAAAIELCNIAKGSAELFLELHIKPWDYAAATLIVKEAGGIISDINGNELQFEKDSSVVAHNGLIDYKKYI